MNKILPLILFLITNWAFSITNTIPTNKKNKDSLINSHQKASHNHEAETITSNAFINALEKKFPKQNHSSPHTSLNPEFSWDYIQKTFIPDSLTTNQKSAATESFTKIDNENLWVDQFANEDIVSLPIGVKYSLGNVEYAIGIVKAEFHSDYTILTAFARVTIQQSDKNGNPMELFFGADDVKLSHQGGIIGDAKLVLLGDVAIPFNGGNWLIQLYGGLDYRSGITNALSYVTIDCSGIKNLALNGAVEFSRNMLIPIEQDGKVHEEKTTIQNNYPNRVKGAFNIIADNWSDIIVEISLQPFVRANKRNGKDYKGNMEFYLNKAVLDFSDLRNAPDIQFPNFYHENGLLMPNPNTWKGIYIETLDVRLPEEFKTKETIQNKQRISLGAHQFILDSHGLSGSFYGDNIFSIDEGRTNDTKAWAISLDHIEVSLAANHLVGASFQGRILLPVSKEKNEDGTVGLRYDGYFSEEEYGLRVTNDSKIDFGLFSAEGQLAPNSSIELIVIEGQFRPKATLHGRLAINASQKETLQNSPDATSEKKKGTVQFKGIEFQNLVLQTESPILSIAYLGYHDEVKLGNFPASIGNIVVSTNNNEASLWFDLKINLMDGAGFAADARIGILAANYEEDYQQKWKFKGLDISAINIAADMGGFAINGSLMLMEDDPVYGDGFYASLKATFSALGNAEIGASGIFGRTNGFRYWYFDAMVDNLAPPGTPGVIIPKGFSGGAFYKMKRKGFDPAFSTLNNQNGPVLNTSGLTYVPDNNQGLGLKAMILFSVVSTGVADGGAGFETLFNAHGGISSMGFYGEAEIMAELPLGGKINNLLDKVKENTDALNDYIGNDIDDITNSTVGKPFLKKAELSFPKLDPSMQIKAITGIEYDFENKTLHGEMDLYVNLPGGVVQGRASEGRAGWAVLHLSPEEWYLHLGTPTDRLGLKLGVGPISVESGGYFMVGDRIPGSPPPPPIVAEILGVDAQSLDYMRDENSLGEGRGFAFGADFSLDTGDLNFLIFYARFQAGAGFDIMLKDYGEAACANRSGEQIGINGWYANGQAYAYLQGELGINIKLFFVRKKIPIIKGGAAVLLQAKAPNPIWMRGYVGGHFNLLGGLVKGRFRFKLTIGEACELIDASPLGGMKIITDLTPKDGTGDVDVFAAPQATFSMKVNQPIVIPEDDGDKTYKIVLEKFKLLHNGKEIEGELKWGTNKDRATFISTDILPPSQDLKVEVEVSFQEQKNGVFQTIMVDGQKVIEIEARSFKTGQAPTAIPLQNIQYAYPVIDQKYFFKDETDQGYIQLLRGQDYLFNLQQWTTEVLFTNETETAHKTAFNYDNSNNRIYYDFSDLSNDKKYHIAITSSTNASGKNNHTDNEYTATNMSNDNTVSIKQNRADHVVKEGFVERLAYNFSSSKFDTFKEKIRHIHTTENNWGKIYSDVIYLTNQIESDEPFDVVELIGNDYTENKPLVVTTALLDDDYFTKDINPPLYSQYPLGNQYEVAMRDVNEYGIPPKKAVPVMINYLSYAEHDMNETWRKKVFPYFYNLPYLYKQDWSDLYAQILNDYVNGNLTTSHKALKFLDYNYLFMRYGNYTVNMQYVLPGGKQGTNKTYDFKNIIKFR